MLVLCFTNLKNQVNICILAIERRPIHASFQYLAVSYIGCAYDMTNLDLCDNCYFHLSNSENIRYTKKTRQRRKTEALKETTQIPGERFV